MLYYMLELYLGMGRSHIGFLLDRESFQAALAFLKNSVLPFNPCATLLKIPTSSSNPIVVSEVIKPMCRLVSMYVSIGQSLADAYREVQSSSHHSFHTYESVWFPFVGPEYR